MVENKLTELGKGLFQFGPKEKPEERQTLRVFVHPYCSCDDVYEDDEEYVRKRDDLIVNEKSPIIILSDENDYQAVAKRYSDKALGGYRMIVLTEESDPQPLTRTWGELREMIKGEFNPRKVIISGAEYWVDSNEIPVTGCVYGAYLGLMELRPVIEKETCYKLMSSRDDEA